MVGSVSGCAGLKEGLIPDEKELLRRVKKSEILRSGAIKKSAFLPSKNGKDATGLSVSIKREDMAELHREKFAGHDDRRAAAIRTDQVRKISASGRKLAVIWAPVPEDPAHALIAGIPAHVDPCAEDRAVAERFAELLARAAVEYRFD